MKVDGADLGEAVREDGAEEVRESIEVWEAEFLATFCIFNVSRSFSILVCRPILGEPSECAAHRVSGQKRCANCKDIAYCRKDR